MRAHQELGGRMAVLRPPGLTPACIWLLSSLQSRQLEAGLARGHCPCLVSFATGEGSECRISASVAYGFAETNETNSQMDGTKSVRRAMTYRKSSRAYLEPMCSSMRMLRRGCMRRCRAKTYALWFPNRLPTQA